MLMILNCLMKDLRLLQFLVGLGVFGRKMPGLHISHIKIQPKASCDISTGQLSGKNELPFFLSCL